MCESYDRAASESILLPRLQFCASCWPVTEELLAFIAQKTADDGNAVIPFFENVPAGDETSAPFIDFVAVLAAVGVDVFLRNSIDDGADFGPDAGAGAHGAGLVRGIQDKVRQVAAVTAADVFEHFEFDVLDARARGFHAVAGTGDDRLALACDARDDSADGVITAVAGPLGLCDGKFHEFLFRFIRGRDHAIRLYAFITAIS